MKLLHVGLCVQPPPYNGMQTAFMDVLGKDNYAEISTGDKLLNSESVYLFEAIEPNIVFMQVQAPGIIHSDVVRYFSKTAKVINWTGDVRHEVPQWIVDIAPYCTSSFSNMTDVLKMQAKGYEAKYLEIGYDPLRYTPDGDKTNVPDIVFMVNNYGRGYFPLSNYRMDIVNKLTKYYGTRFGVFGNGWPMAKGNINHSQPEESKHYRSSKIAINCSHFNYQRYSSDRMLRILGSGTFCLSHHYSGIEQDYIPGKHLDTFNSIEDLIKKINYYLENEEERNKIAKTGNELVLNRNTFTHMVKNILEL